MDELLLCHFIAVLAREGLSLATMKTNLVGVCHTQIMRGLQADGFDGVAEVSVSGCGPRST